MVNHGIGSNETTLSNVSTTDGYPAIEVVGHHPWTHVQSQLTPSAIDCVVTQRDVVANDSMARTTDARVDDTIISHDSAGAEFDVITYDTAISNHDTIVMWQKLPMVTFCPIWALGWMMEFEFKVGMD